MTTANTKEKPKASRAPVKIRKIPAITYPDDLPVSEKRDEIALAIQNNQVVIVSGETGSGKTTQLPKICLDLGRGRRKMIAHTQPRRLAATSVANRIAQELNTEIGDLVGYQIRFGDKTSTNTAVKLMTDGILLAQTQKDPNLRQYDTIIIDEAHERSLNIDFLLGFLKQLLPKRPDLKLIITSATIDSERFANHFAVNGKKAPVIDVSGRLYPVDIIYNPSYEDDIELDLSVLNAVTECQRFGSGDVLVFLPGEREIRDAADTLNNANLRHTEILPLYARLSRAEQDRIFNPKTNANRVILATNVAETSLTVPGIRYVIDSGLARIKRYSWRNKVEQLRIEPISQASANQRAGRCGRVGPGICIRLYDEEDFNKRDKFTDPEILRSSLAAVILKMKFLGLQDVENFPFVDAPHGRAIADGYHILQELNAITETGSLTSIGRVLAKLPIDPKLARMILAANQYQCLSEMLVIVAALSVQDPRERPMTQRDAANQAHAKFKDPKSEFISYIKIWDWYHKNYQERQSQRKFVSLLRENFLSPARMREWRDIYAQLTDLIKEHKWRLNTSNGTYEQLHTALLYGLLGNVGFKLDEANGYQGTREIKFLIHPGSSLAKKAGRWVMAAELVDTSRLFARCIAKIEPEWIEKAGAHVIRKNLSMPRWEKRGARVVANEKATLYGLTVYSGRKVNYGRFNADHAREIFIREALVTGEINTKANFVIENTKLIQQIEKLEHQSRRPDILVDDELIYAFYDAHIPKDIYSNVALERWYKLLDKETKNKLTLSRDDLMRHDAAGITTNVFPRSVKLHGTDLKIDYHFEPGSLRDGATLTVPLLLLSQIEDKRWQWLVTGMLKEKVTWLIRSLPQRIRRHCVPVPDYVQGFYNRWFDYSNDPKMGLLEAIITDLQRQLGLLVQENDFKPDTLPPHLLMNFKVVDDYGRMLSGGRNLDQLKNEHQVAAQELFQKTTSKNIPALQAVIEDNITAWSFEELPEILEIKKGRQSFIGYPALVDKETHCEIDVFDDLDEAQGHHLYGVLRLFKIHLKEQIKYLQKNLPDIKQMALLYISIGTQEELTNQIIDLAIQQACLSDGMPSNSEEFEFKCKQGKAKVSLLAQEIARLIKVILTQWHSSRKKLNTIKAHKLAYDDINLQLNQLMHKNFISESSYARLRHYSRYLKSAEVRIDKLFTNPSRDTELMQQMAPLLNQYIRTSNSLKGKIDKKLLDFYWLLHELRVALFAQELKTPTPVSIKRLQRAWDNLY